MYKKPLLVAINSKYIHSCLGIRYIAKYSELHGIRADIAEYTINNYANDIIMDIYQKKPDFIGFSCYIWNFEMVLKVAEELKKIMPQSEIWFGGPEVSYDSYNELIKYPFLKGIMIGEGEITCKELLSGYNLKDILSIAYRDDNGEIFVNELRDYMDMNEVPFVYDDLSKFDNKIIYYESSRGCPYSCSYCMSSVDKRVRYRDIEKVKKELKFFIDNKVKQVKFVDRTFNCNKERTIELWRFIKENDNGVTNFHFEVSADILDDDEIKEIAGMRPHLIQLEIGVQSTNEETIRAIRRKMDFKKLSAVVKKIKKYNNVHQHLDLIAGLPFENLERFKKSFNDVYKLMPEQLQLGFLKVLKGSYMYEKAADYGIVYKTYPPYEVLYTQWLSYDEVIYLKRIEEMVEVYYNSGQFCNTIKYLEHLFKTPFELYDFMGEYYKKFHPAIMSYSRIDRYNILRDMFEFYYDNMEHKKLKESKEEFLDVISELMIHDIYLRENIKTRPVFAKDESIYKDIFNSFFKNEEKVRSILVNYEAYNTKQIARMCHAEYYDYDINLLCKKGSIVRKDTIYLYDYQNRDAISYNALYFDVTDDVFESSEKERVFNILKLLDKHYGTTYKCYLNHENAWQLLIATILSAQCTDERVNIVTKDLFIKYPSLEDFAKADVKELEKDIYSTGFYKNKAKNIIACCNDLVNMYNGEVPSDIDKLTKLAGVGRKTANVIRGNIYNIPSIVVDTHVKRISNKLGFTKEDDPVKIEKELMKVLPEDHWILFNIQIITHGRKICTAIKPKCNECFLNCLCRSAKI